jgi:hypothetical protein
MSTSHTKDPTAYEVAYAVHVLKNCHDCDPVDGIMGLAQHFTKWSRMNASENVHIQLNKCIFKVIKPIIRDCSLQPLKVTHDNQLCHTCIYKITPLITLFTVLDCM